MTGSDRTPMETVKLLATALDADAFDAVRSLLSHDVIYQTGAETHCGPDAVVRSYMDGSARARSLFDRVEFDHTLTGLVGDRTVRVDFSDRLEVAGDLFVHHSVQDVEVDDESMVVIIVDQSVPGQRERLDAFLKGHGLTRPAADGTAT